MILRSSHYVLIPPSLYHLCSINLQLSLLGKHWLSCQLLQFRLDQWATLPRYPTLCYYDGVRDFSMQVARLLNCPGCKQCIPFLIRKQNWNKNFIVSFLIFRCGVSMGRVRVSTQREKNPYVLIFFQVCSLFLQSAEGFLGPGSGVDSGCISPDCLSSWIFLIGTL